MKLAQVQRDTLLKPLQAVTGIVEKRHTLPILSNVLLRAADDTIDLLATDLEIQISTRTKVERKNTEPLSLTVSARKFQDILRALPDGSDLILDAQTNRLQVKAGKSRFNLQTLPATDFPTIADTGEPLSTFTIEQGQLRQLLLLVQYAMAQQDIRYYLNGLLLLLDGTEIKVVATDGHRLAYAAGNVTSKQQKHEVILPRKAVVELCKQLLDNDSSVELTIYSSHVKFGFADVELVTKVIDGKFPDFGRVIPTGYTKQITIERPVLLHSLQRAGILSNEKFRGVRWTLTEGALRISCTNNEQEEALEEIEVDYKGEPLDVGFNITYLLDLLNNVSSEKVVCSFGDATSSMLITLPEMSDFRYVVMPMRI